MEPAWELILGQSSEASLATGPVIAEPLVSPLLLTMTPALSSQQRKVPSGRLQALRWRMMTAGWTFFLSFWTPFLTEQRTTSPMEPAGRRLRDPRTPWTAIMKRFLAPELSAQLRVAATGSPLVILSLTPTAPVLVFLAMLINQYNIQQINRLPLQQRMFQFFTSFGASSNFEKYRLEITAKTYDAPNEQSLRYVVNAFGGQDPETKSQIAYATIVKKLLTSDSKNNWLYLLKNLIIFDRVCQENLFTEEISAVSIPTIDQFKESDQKYMLLDTQRLLKGYWRLIKEKSNILASRKHIFCFKRGQRMQYLSKLTAAETLKQIQSIETFFAMTYDLIDILSGKKMIDEATVQTDKIVRAREQFGKSRLLEYLYLHIMHKLMQYYSCQLQCNNYFLQIIIKRSQELRDEEIRKYRKNIIKFKQNSNDYIKFVEERKQIKGFEELNYKELNPFQSEDIVKTIDLLLAAKNHDSSVHESIEYIFGESKMSVQKKPLNDMNKDQLIPRLKMTVRKSQQSMKDLKMERVESEQETNSFLNYNNSYSSEFPQKEIMTVDLIMQLKEQDKENNDEMIELQSSVRDFCNYNDRDTNVSTNFQLSYQYCRENGEHTLNFHSIFSGNPKHWNS